MFISFSVFSIELHGNEYFNFNYMSSIDVLYSKTCEIHVTSLGFPRLYSLYVVYVCCLF